MQKNIRKFAISSQQILRNFEFVFLEFEHILKIF